MSIAEFLLARIAEDEAVARERPSSAYIHASGCYYYNYSLDANWFCDCDEDGESSARILAECAAKRTIVELRPPKGCIPGDDLWGAYDDCHYAALRALAAVYADHPDYNPEWAL